LRLNFTPFFLAASTTSLGVIEVGKERTS